ncbi:MAG: AAA family ATPase [Clostridiales bacterium]|nr:AAA family ATPase [Clostridiales bacterium]
MLGCDEFKILRKNDYYYIDKSMFIKEFLEKGEMCFCRNFSA